MSEDTPVQSSLQNGTKGVLVDPDRQRAQNTQITGTVQYQARNGSMQPARRVKVKIRKKTIAGHPNPVIKTTTTNDSGQYDVSVDVASWENSPGDEDLHVRVQACAQNPAVKVIRLSNAIQGGCKRIHHIGTDGWVTVGQNTAQFDLSATGETNRRSFQIAEWALQAREVIEAKTGFTRSRVKVNYDDLINLYGDRYLSHIQKIKLTDDNWDARKNFTVYHEYGGHGILDGLYGNKMMKIPTTRTWLRNTDDGWFPCHVRYSETDPVYAWYEGYAQFSSAVVNDDPDTDNLQLESHHWFNHSETHADCLDGDGSPHPDYDGEKVEGAVANILWDVYDEKNESHDDINASLKEIYGAVSKNRVRSAIAKRNTKRVWNIHDFWDQFRTDENHAALGRIYFEYGVQKPDKFEDNDRYGTAAELRHGITDSSKLAGGYPKNGYNISDGAQLNYGDPADHYEFEAQLFEHVSVEINSTQGNANADLYVYAPNGSLIAKSTSSDSNESVQFRAMKTATYVTHTAGNTGLYHIKVNDTASGRTAGTYTFNLSVEPSDAKDDRFEPNGAITDATKLSPGTYEDLKIIGIGTYDWYAIDLDSDESLAVEAEFDHDVADIQLLMYHPAINPSNQKPNVVKKSVSNTDDERLVWHARQPGTHYLLVRAPFYSGPQASYDLNLSIHDQPLQTYEDNDHRTKSANLTAIAANTGKRSNQAGYIVDGYAPGDPDYFSIDLNDFESLELGIEEGSNISVDVYGPNGWMDDLDSVGQSDIFRPSSNGEYIVKVSGDSQWETRYNVSVAYGRGVGNDDYEPNNGFNQATPATPEIGVTETSGTKTFPNLAVNGYNGDDDYFRVNVTSGVEVTATLRKKSGDPDLTIVGETSLTRDTKVDSTTKRASRTASQSGTFYVKVEPGANPPQVERYELEIEKTTSVTTGPTVDQQPVGIGGSDNSFTPVLQGGGGGWFLGGNLTFTTPGTQPCTPSTTKTFSRTVNVDGGQSVKLEKRRAFNVGSLDPCKVEVVAAGPQGSELNIFVTLDGSRPTTNNYQVAGQDPGSFEFITLKPGDGLRSGASVRALARAYPVSGTYDVTITIFTRG